MDAHFGQYGRDAGGGWLVVDALPGTGSIVTKPLSVGRDHALVRPHHRLAGPSGNPDTGHVLYAMGTLNGRDPRVLAAVAIKNKQPRQPRDLLPKNVFLFPGITIGRRHTNRRGQGGGLHHVSVREHDAGGIQTYAHLVDGTVSHRPLSAKTLQPQSELGGLVNVCEVFAKDWTAFDHAGMAALPVGEGAWRRAIKEGCLSRPGFVKSHYLLDIPAPVALAARPNFMWQGAFLGQRPLTDEDVHDILWFYGHHMNPKLSGMEYDADYDGDINGHVLTLPLDFDVPSDEPYSFLHIVTSVLPGRLHSGTAVSAFASFMPFLRADQVGRELEYESYAKDLEAQSYAPLMAR